MTADDAVRILEEAHPEQAILTHFGMRMVLSGPAREARLIQEKTGVPTIAAEDGMRVIFAETIEVQKCGQKNPQGLNGFL